MPNNPERNSSLTSDLAALRLERPPGAARPRRLAAYAASTITLIAIAATFLLHNGATARNTESPAGNIVSPPVRPSTSAVLSASGYVVARRKAVVSAKIQGRLAALYVEEGSAVRRGQIIARLDNGDLQAQIDVARAQVQRAEADLAEEQRQYQLARRLADAGVMPADQLQAASSRLRVARAALSQSQAGLSLSEAGFRNSIIRAPFDGIVVRKMAEAGESVAPIPPGVNLSTSSGAIVAIADMSSLEVEVDVGESNVARLQRDQPAQISVDAFPDRVHQGVVRAIVPTADRTKATVTVKVAILDKDPDLRPEMSAKVTFLERKESDVRK